MSELEPFKRFYCHAFVVFPFVKFILISTIRFHVFCELMKIYDIHDG